MCCAVLDCLWGSLAFVYCCPVGFQTKKNFIQIFYGLSYELPRDDGETFLLNLSLPTMQIE